MGEFDDSGSWDIMLHMCLDFEGLLSKCSMPNFSISEVGLRDFMRGFTQSLVAPLFNIVDVGQGRENMSRKIGGMSRFLYSLSPQY